ncbi:MAG TPA: hypothetical protein VLL75_01655, partial [Vicinamibacteria bacterium]|nr:hypothetical protein [Vicinamibacteria bacterium]
LGLLTLVVAGLVRLLFFRDVVGPAFEGSALAAAPGAFEAERGGRLSRPFALPRPILVEEIREDRYESGALRQVSARLAIGGGAGAPAETREAAINSPLDDGDVRLYVGNAHGIAALLSLDGPSGATPLVAFLEERGGEWRGGLRPGGGLELRFRANVRPRPRSVETRALVGGVLLGIAALAPGDQIDVGAGQVLRLEGLPFWVQLRGSRDPSKPLFFGGAGVCILGVVLMFSFNRVDTAVFVEGDRLVVALRAQRFAPLLGDRFERLCREWMA